MPKSYEEEEGQIEKALEAYSSGRNRNLSALARDYGVSYSRLRRRANGISSKLGNKNRPRLLTEAQEAAIVRVIDSLRRYNIKLNGRDIEDYANLLLWRQYERDHPEATLPKTTAVLPRLAKAKNRPPGLKLVNHQWAYSFIKRVDPNLVPVADEQISSERARITAAEMQHWFDGLEPVIRQVKHYNIFNFDETGFILGQQASRSHSIGRKGARQARSEKADTREMLTSIECISADGRVIPPFFIFEGSVVLERWFDEPLPNDWVISVSPTGYVNSELAFEWLQHFDEHTINRVEKDEPRLLLFDGHTAHLTAEFFEYCAQARILPFCFISHATHLLQPLDGDAFLTYKTYFRNWNPVFLRGIREIRDETFTPHIIRGSFRKRWIYPFNPELIVKPLTDREEDEFIPLQGFDQVDGDDAHGINRTRERTRSSQSPTLSSSSIELPNTPRSVKKSFTKLQRVIKSPLGAESERKEKVIRRIERLERFTITEFEESIIKDSVISKYKSVQTEFTSTNKSRRQITKVKVLTPRDANRRMVERSEKENQAWVRRVRRENARKAEIDRKIAEAEAKAAFDGSIDSMFEPFGIFRVDTEGDSSLMV
ncbi:uncharacterized protein N7496_010650 [Penicillium cataractarum]|uniref:DDE-1 domain-containing protein n=1 Tax=Penicillium cataractarum TaxID=2100454 RepID=A0A9W9RRH7_9EURO|nr:uncharacterized protein N7496_010650 [Penicillium cataractarum]KAJ5364937.1 hypothetical protein N7496_010650 [Penicillium cataractarum]